MDKAPIDRRRFWEEKISGWERQRYAEFAADASVFERARRPLGASVRFRLHLASELLRPHVRDRRITELGCGTGRLAPLLVHAGAREYVGLDISENAVEQARQRVSRAGCADRTRFERMDVASLSTLDTDVVISLGLFDWLSEAEQARVFEAGARAHFLHSFSEARAALGQRLHRLYVYLAYGHRTRGYIPAYQPAAEIESIARRHRDGPIAIVRDRRLSFGAFITSLPAGG